MPQLMTLGAPAPGGVCIAIPSYGAMSPVAVFALAAGIRALTAAGIPYDVVMLGGNCHVDDARNCIVRTFLESDSEHLLFIDADLTYSPEDLLRIIGHKRDVVAGIYPRRDDGPTYPVRHLKTPTLQAESDGLLEVEGVPTGFLKLSRAALSKLAERATKYFEQEGDPTLTPLIFERSVEGTTRFSGDYTFCRKWRALGGQIFIDPEIRFGHLGDKEWRGCYGAHLRTINKLPLRGVQLIGLGLEQEADLRALHEEWGNGVWAAPVEMIQACVAMARSQLAGSLILEVGAGLTTLCMAAANPAIRVHALEHDAAWYNRIMDYVSRHQLTNVHIEFAPIVDGWYSAPLPKATPAAVVIDGPPRWLGDRMQIWKRADLSGTLIIDDMTDEWRKILTGQARTFNEVGRFAIVGSISTLHQAA